MGIQEVCHIANLICKYIKGTISGEESLILEVWKNASEYNQQLFDEFVCHTFIDRKQIEEHLCDYPGAYRKVILRKDKFVRQKRYRKWGSRVAIAAIMAGISITALLPFREEVNEGVLTKQEKAIVAGRSKAVLVLSDGSNVVLTDSPAKDTLLLENGSQIVQERGKVSYQGVEKGIPSMSNTLRVPRGGNFIVTLDDGTVVYLNSVSELRYPVQFAGNERRVYLSGEAYFEVAKDMARPFYVETDHLNIQVYGTVFNVNTRVSGKVQAVLVEGKIGLRAESGAEHVLAPSQLATYDIARGKVEIREVNTRLYTAWQEGWFLFENERLEDVLARLSLWYDVDIVYQSPRVKELRIFGSMKHYESIEVILRAIEMNVNVYFKIDGRTIVVSE